MFALITFAAGVAVGAIAHKWVADKALRAELALNKAFTKDKAP